MKISQADYLVLRPSWSTSKMELAAEDFKTTSVFSETDVNGTYEAENSSPLGLTKVIYLTSLCSLLGKQSPLSKP